MIISYISSNVIPFIIQTLKKSLTYSVNGLPLQTRHNKARHDNNKTRHHQHENSSHGLLLRVFLYCRHIRDNNGKIGLLSTLPRKNNALYAILSPDNKQGYMIIPREDETRESRIQLLYTKKDDSQYLGYRLWLFYGIWSPCVQLYGLLSSFYFYIQSLVCILINGANKEGMCLV